MRHVRAYAPLALVALVALVAGVLVPGLVIRASGTVGHRFTQHDAGLVTLGVRAVLALVAAGTLWLIWSERRKAWTDAEFWDSQDRGAIETYDGFVQETGADPEVARSVVEATSLMPDEMRRGDFNRANMPNFAAELGYRLGVDQREMRGMMRDFFLENQDNSTKRSFSTSMRITMENGKVEQTHDTKAEVEPALRYAPADPENDPNWRGTGEDMGRRILSWEDDPVELPAWEDENAHDSLAVADKEADDKEEERAGIGVGAQNTHVGFDHEVLAEDEADPRIPPEAESEYSPEASELGAEVFTRTEADDDDEYGYADSMFHVEEESAVADDGAEPSWDQETEFEIEEGGFDTEEEKTGWNISLMVQNDPVIAGLINSIRLTRKLPPTDSVRALYAIYGSAVEDLVAVFEKPIVKRADDTAADIEPFFYYFGVSRFKTAAWTLHLAGKTIHEDDLDATAWIPVGIATLGGEAELRAWKLLPVRAGTNATFYAPRDRFPLAAARLDWILGNLYGDLEVTDDEAEGVTSFFIPSLSINVDLMETDHDSHGDFDIRSDIEDAGGPEQPEMLSLALLSDGLRGFFAKRVGEDRLTHENWLALFSLAVVLCMREEPVSTRDVLGKWAEPTTVRGKELLELIRSAFGENLECKEDEWELSNVRVDVFWVDGCLRDLSEVSVAQLRGFFESRFDPDNLEFLLNRGSMDPRARSGDEIKMDQLIRKVLRDVAETLGPDAEGRLADNIDVINQILERS